MPPRFPARAEDIVPNRINRAPSPFHAVGIPWASILSASMATFSPFIASAPSLPPFSYMMSSAWRMSRPGMSPVWVGLPSGAIDDSFSGQPFGSAIISWSSTMSAMEVIDERFLWRGFSQDWLAGSASSAAVGVGFISAKSSGGSSDRHEYRNYRAYRD
ncbi:hypothetical protein OY671_009058 [Metschnikowia pulcherrima]|nr:hypothetical protein OY671_009058 [Metschnikowia pulcherrima]